MWSSDDEKIRNIDRMDESTGQWHYRRNGREVSAKEAARYGAANDRSQNGYTASAVNPAALAPSAKEVDLAHQATGVPSLGAEAVNFAPGKP